MLLFCKHFIIYCVKICFFGPLTLDTLLREVGWPRSFCPGGKKPARPPTSTSGWYFVVLSVATVRRVEFDPVSPAVFLSSVPGARSSSSSSSSSSTPLAPRHRYPPPPPSETTAAYSHLATPRLSPLAHHAYPQMLLLLEPHLSRTWDYVCPEW